MTATLCTATILSTVLALPWLLRAQPKSNYTVLKPLIEGNLMVFPVTTESVHDTHLFLTLDDGLRLGQVIVSEAGGSHGFVRPRPGDRVPPRDFPIPGRDGAEVNRLTLTNNSDRPLLLLAGEIVTGGKQDRVVGKDRIIPAHSGPVDLSVFCVEPHRWMGASAQFGTKEFLMAQPSVRKSAMADKDQSEVWDQVAKSRQAVAAAAPAAAPFIAGSSSYAGAMQNQFVQKEVDSLAAPVQRSYEKLFGELRAQHAVGAVVAVNGEIVWADVFASPALFQAYWPKLVRSYAAEALETRAASAKFYNPPTVGSAQAFLDDLNATHEKVDSQPGLYRETELVGEHFEAFILKSLLPGGEFEVHFAKMRT